MQNVYVKTLGCKVNTYDSDSLETQFRDKGYKVVRDPKEADISILNTCSVTENADKEARYLLRRFKRENPEALIVATGCYAQTDSQKLLDMGDVDLVFPNEVKDRVASVSDEQLKVKRAGQDLTAPKIPADVKPVAENKQGHFKSSLKMLAADSNKTRAFLKIQDGCNGFCSYCLIPYARGASRSVAPAEVKTEVRRLIDQGVKEIVFTGIHIGDYGDDIGAQSLTDLIAEMMDWPDMIRLRISSLEPRELPEKLLKVLAQRPELFCDHFHLPLQAGDDRILKMMRRTYTTSQYADTVAMARSYFPKAYFGADIIPGFPSETDEEFQNTMAFIKSTGLNYLHVFPYSKRPNTAAAKMPGHLDGQIVKARSKELRDLSATLKEEYFRRFLGETVSVLWEKDKDKSGRAIGHSRNYLDIVAPSSFDAAPGTINNVKVKGFVEGQRLLGLPQN
mgnify:CR=1 FL=1